MSAVFPMVQLLTQVVQSQVAIPCFDLMNQGGGTLPFLATDMFSSRVRKSGVSRTNAAITSPNRSGLFSKADVRFSTHGGYALADRVFEIRS